MINGNNVESGKIWQNLAKSGEVIGPPAHFRVPVAIPPALYLLCRREAFLCGHLWMALFTTHPAFFFRRDLQQTQDNILTQLLVFQDILEVIGYRPTSGSGTAGSILVYNPSGLFLHACPPVDTEQYIFFNRRPNASQFFQAYRKVKNQKMWLFGFKIQLCVPHKFKRLNF